MKSVAESAFNGTPFTPFKRSEQSRYARKNETPCDGCNKACLFGIDYYMVRNDVWTIEAGLPSNNCMLCIACLSTRLGRELTQADFTETPVNAAIHKAFISARNVSESAPDGVA